MLLENEELVCVFLSLLPSWDPSRPVVVVPLFSKPRSGGDRSSTFNQRPPPSLLLLPIKILPSMTNWMTT